MVRPFASLHRPAGYGYDKKRPVAIEDDPDYLRPTKRVPARAAIPADGGVTAVEPSAPKRRPGQMPLAVEEQIISQNMQRRADDFTREQDNAAQVRRRAAYIKERDRLTSKGGAIPLPNKPLIPAVAPPAPAGSSQSGSTTDAGGSAGNLGGAAVAPAGPVVATPPAAASPVAQPPQPAVAPVQAVSPLSPAGQTAQTIIGAEGGVQGGYNTLETARLAGSSSPVVSGTMQDTANIYSRMNAIPAIQQQYGGDVNAYQRGQQVQAVQAQRAAQQQAEQAAQQRFIQALPIGNVPPSPVRPTAPSRLPQLQAEMERGQAALDQGNSLEQQKRDAEMASERQFAVDLAKASTRPLGSTSQARPTMEPERKAQLEALTRAERDASNEYSTAVSTWQAAVAEYGPDNAKTKASEKVKNDARKVLDDVRKQTRDFLEAKPDENKVTTPLSADSVDPKKAAELVDEVRKKNPTWTKEQVVAEAKRLAGVK